MRNRPAGRSSGGGAPGLMSSHFQRRFNGKNTYTSRTGYVPCL
ncbi:hypothetical protein DesteDRAFT_0026 [Nitratidesulfovibrio termitidis HI1]|uniref:Uncharacterized protein n=1 Tax=Nitratidesulfovibrio termitidis HI1 TaxID=644897 RepID=W9E746_9BACT|nr:hypothetical protein DesteDRAFT_0026 [Nitratidesulfovibrio termitidis HI1]